MVGDSTKGEVGNIGLMLFPKDEERTIKPPSGEQEKNIPVKNLQESPKPGATRFGVKRVNVLISNQNFDAPR